ncbi:MAG: PAS domain S-box protein [Chloroflexi bacterium]|nr:MAG: PAS domain S-box protein [Chloroflexota bacterium]
MSTLSSPNNLLSREELLRRLEETEETLRAIRSGEVDALVVSGAQGDQVFTLKDATLPYQILIEQMSEGALTLNLQGMILFCNERFAEILDFSMEIVLGRSFLHFVIPGDQARARELLEQRPDGRSRGELTLLGGQAEVPVGISLKEIQLDGELRFGVVITDLTERKQVELELKHHKENLEMLVQERTKELQESHSQLSRAEQIGEIGSWEWRIPENRVTWSDGLYRLFGLAPHEFGATYDAYLERVHAEDRERVRQIVDNALLTGGVFECESRILRKDGQIRYLYTKGETLPAEPGESARMIGIATDITERKRTEMKLQESEARYRGLLESQLDLIVRVDLAGRFTFVNDAYCQKFGLKREEILGRESYQPLVHPEDLPHTLEAMKALYRPPYRAIMEQRAFTLEGVRWIEWQDSAIRDESGTIVEIQAIGRDITARKQAEAALRESEQRLNRAQEIAHLGSWELNLVNNQLTWSDEVYRIFGLEPQEFGATYQAFLEAVHPDDRAAVDAAYSGSLREGRDGYEIEHRVVRRSSGEIRIVHEKCEHFRNEDGQVVHSTGMVHDITERKQSEAAMQRITEDLLRSNAELEQFAYVASHDLQEPLRMISSYVQLLARRYQGKLDSDADEFIAFVVEGTNRMQNLINDLLAYSRVGMRGNPFAPVSAEYLLEEALANLQLAIEESGAKITHDPLPTVNGDAIQLVMVFQNLLGNAIKFRGSEPICVHVGVTQAGNEWVFSVRDNGIGIDPRFAKRIFVIFQRLHERASYPGTGIGLAICKRIIQRHGGRIWVDSEAGKGATFYFTIPMKETL